MYNSSNLINGDAFIQNIFLYSLVRSLCLLEHKTKKNGHSLILHLFEIVTFVNIFNQLAPFLVPTNVEKLLKVINL